MKLVERESFDCDVLQSSRWPVIVSAEHNLSQLLESAKKIEMTLQEQEQQRRSFAYGNAKIENEDITHEAIEKAASVLAGDDSK